MLVKTSVVSVRITFDTAMRIFTIMARALWKAFDPSSMSPLWVALRLVLVRGLGYPNSHINIIALILQMEPVGNGSHSEPLNNIGAGNSQQRRTSSISTNTSPTVSRRPSHYFVRNATTDGWATPSRSPERVTQKFGSFSRKLLSEVRVVGSTLRRSDTYINDVTHRTKDYDDPRYLNEDQAGAGNGVR